MATPEVDYEEEQQPFVVGDKSESKDEDTSVRKRRRR